MPIVPAGTTNLNAQGVPNVIAQIVPPNPVIQGVSTDSIVVVGTANGGPINSQQRIGNMQQYTQIFGTPNPIQYDMGSAVYVATLQGASNFICVRVTDGTDTSAFVDLLDGQISPVVGATLTAIYTGSLYNNVFAVISTGSNSITGALTYKLSIYLSGGISEVFDNIGGIGHVFWENLVSAVNFGQSNARGPSQLVIATVNSVVSSVTVTVPGANYTSIPTIVQNGPGTGATYSVVMGTYTSDSTVAAGGSGYVVNDTITLTGGTFTTAAVITVNTVDGGGAVLTFTITTQGSYTVLPSNPVAQGSTSGVGVGATFNLKWHVHLINVIAGGSGYDSTSTISITGGSGSGALATLNVGSTAAPDLNSPPNPYQLSGGTSGTNVTSSDLLGDDSATPRTGLYAARGSQAAIGVLADADDETLWDAQAAFGSYEGMYMQLTMAPGFQDNIAGAVALRATEGLLNFEASLLQGDWVQFNDVFNNQIRYISPASWKAGILAVTPVNGSSLNKVINGISATQKTAESRTYSDTDLSQLETGGLEVITRPIPVNAAAYGCRLGINTSGNPLTNTDNYPRMINYLALSLQNGLGQFIGLPYSSDNVRIIKDTIQAFLGSIASTQRAGGPLIGTLDGSPAYSVTMDTSQAPLGILVANVQVVLFSIIQVIVLNLQANQGVDINVLPAQAA